MAVRVQEAASLRLDEIYRYTRDRWGAEQADRYITDLFVAFGKIEVHGVASRTMNRPGFTGVQNSRRIARYGTDIKEENREAVFT